MSGDLTRPRNRAERRALRRDYRRVDVRHTCDVIVYDALAGKTGMRPCGVELVATFVVEADQPTPNVTFRHNPDGSHEPILSGTGIAATSRRQGHVVGGAEGKLQ